MRELAEVCELSTGTLYHYFGSKEELLYYIIHSATTQQVEYLESFARDLETAEPTMALVQLVRRFFEWHDVNQDITLFTYQETKNLPRNARQDIFDSEGRIHDLFERFLRRGIESGEFNIDDPSLTAHNIMVLGHAWALRRWYVRKYWTIESYAKLQTDAILKAIQAGVAH